MNDRFGHAPKRAHAKLQPSLEFRHDQAERADFELVIRDLLRGDGLEHEGDQRDVSHVVFLDDLPEA